MTAAMTRDKAGAYVPVDMSFAGPKTSDATAGVRTWTAQAMLGGLLVRTPGSAITDLPDTAANIVAAMDNPQVGSSFFFIVINLTAAILTLGTSTGVTLAGTTAIASSAIRMYHAQVTALGASPAVLITGIGAMSA